MTAMSVVASTGSHTTSCDIVSNRSSRVRVWCCRRHSLAVLCLRLEEGWANGRSLKYGDCAWLSNAPAYCDRLRIQCDLQSLDCRCHAAWIIRVLVKPKPIHDFDNGILFNLGEHAVV